MLDGILFDQLFGGKKKVEVLMLRRRVQINHIDKVEIHADPQWLWHTLELRDLIERAAGPRDQQYPQSAQLDKPAWVTVLNRVAGVLSVLSGLAILVVVVLIIMGAPAVAGINVATLLTVFSTSLVGSLLSVGGTTLFTLSANLRRTKQEITAIAAAPETCPFEAISQQAGEVMRPGNPQFCVKCPLGIDRIGDEDRGYLMHNCGVYDELHRAWARTPEGRKELARLHPSP